MISHRDLSGMALAGRAALFFAADFGEHRPTYMGRAGWHGMSIIGSDQNRRPIRYFIVRLFEIQCRASGPLVGQIPRR